MLWKRNNDLSWSLRVLKLGGMGQETYIVKTYFPAIFVEITGKKIHSVFFFIRTIFLRTLRLRFAPKFKKMFGLK